MHLEEFFVGSFQEEIKVKRPAVQGDGGEVYARGGEAGLQKHVGGEFVSEIGGVLSGVIEEEPLVSAELVLRGGGEFK